MYMYFMYTVFIGERMQQDQCIPLLLTYFDELLVGHCCKSFPFFFSVDTSIIRKNIRIISYHLIFISISNKEIDHSNSYKHRIISNFDTYDVTKQFFG